jgi:hypothetical protein
MALEIKDTDYLAELQAFAATHGVRDDLETHLHHLGEDPAFVCVVSRGDAPHSLALAMFELRKGARIARSTGSLVFHSGVVDDGGDECVLKDLLTLRRPHWRLC